MATKAVATKGSKSTALVSWEEQMRARATKAVANVAKVGGGGQFFSIKAGVLAFNGNPLANNQMNVAVLGAMLENNYFEDKYDPNTPASPVCYAFADMNDPDAEMKPHPQSEQPQAQSCAECEWNKFGSSDSGNKKGKACKNTARLALLHEDYLKTQQGIKEGTVGFLKLPVTSVGNYAGYAKQVAEVCKKPPEAVITQIKVVPDAKSQFKVTFQLVDDKLPKDTVAALFDRADKVVPTMPQPYPPNGEREPTKPARKNAKLQRGRK